jgi:hypothetical protein
VVVTYRVKEEARVRLWTEGATRHRPAGARPLTRQSTDGFVRRRLAKLRSTV